jgi:hypothetical protein
MPVASGDPRRDGEPPEGQIFLDELLDGESTDGIPAGWREVDGYPGCAGDDGAGGDEGRPGDLATAFGFGTGEQAGEVAGYRIPYSLHHVVKTRQRTCSFPGCRRAARRCHDDHTLPHDQGGRSCECNLAPLCMRHHQAKQSRGWRLDQPAPGVLVWQLPHGRRYTVTPGLYPIATE